MKRINHLVTRTTRCGGGNDDMVVMVIITGNTGWQYLYVWLSMPVSKRTSSNSGNLLSRWEIVVVDVVME